MASETILQNLFELAKSSLYFKGLSEKDIWQACLKYKDRTDADLKTAMENIRAEDKKIQEESKRKQNLITQNKERIGNLRKEEGQHWEQDEKSAHEILEDFFD